MRIFSLALAACVAFPWLFSACDESSESGSGGGSGSAVACGDGVCSDETCESCPEDCGPCRASCGDSLCTTGETCTSCPHDCWASCTCGDGLCTNALEDCISCSADCGECPPGCPDGTCDEAAGESCITCSLDCDICPDVCGDDSCGWNEDCTSCPADCGACAGCGDTFCDGDEDCASCPADCGACSGCGDSACDGDEDCASCPEDCGSCVDSCEDEVTNNDETDVDCGGGTCPACPVWWNCEEGADCESDSCIEGLCYPCDSATLTWNAPTTYSDLTCLPITDLYGFTVYYGQTSGGPYPNVVPLTVQESACFETTTPDPGGCGNLWECTYTIFGLSNGLWYFAVSSVALDQTESDLTPEVSKDFDCP